jgi:hypothetical protein
VKEVIMYCPTCGKEVPENSEFCISCGTSIRQGRPAAQELATKVKTASRDALTAFKVFAVNPVGGLSVAFESLDRNRAMWVGIFFAVVFDVLMLLGMYLGIKHVQGGMGSLIGFYPSFEGPKFSDILKLLVFGAVPPVSISLSSLLARKIFHGTEGFEGDVFIAGAALLPFAFFSVITGLLGIANFEVIAILLVFVMCYTILMLYSGCTKISKISEGGAAVAVPIMLLSSIWFSKIILSALWKNL